jgi:hypothetical protein
MPITNSAQMMTMMSDVASNVIKRVSAVMLNDLKERIWEDTYMPLPNIWYYNDTKTPTSQFKNAFKFDDIQQNLNEVVTELFYDWASMSYDPETYLHGSPSGGDMREQLAEILNVDGTTGFSSKMRKPYWDNFIKEMFDEGGLEKLFDMYMKDEFKKVGLTIIKG